MYRGIPAKEIITKARNLGLMPKKMAMVANVHPASIYRWEKDDLGPREPMNRLKKHIETLEKLGCEPQLDVEEEPEEVKMENGASDVIVEAQLAGMTMREIGKAAGVSQSTLSAWKKNNSGEPRPLEKIREAVRERRGEPAPSNGSNGSNGTGHLADQLTHRIDLSNVQPTKPQPKAQEPAPEPEPEPEPEVAAPVVEFPAEAAPAPESPTETVLYLCQLDNGPMVSDPSLKDAVMKVISKYNGGNPISAITAQEMLGSIRFSPLGYGTTSIDAWQPVKEKLEVCTTWELCEK